MAVFFLLVGLEIKREAIEGPLVERKAGGIARDRRVRRLCHAGGDLCRGELGRRPRVARLGHTGGDRHRLCARRLRHAGTQGAGFAEDLSDGARDHRRPDGHHRHRDLLYRGPFGHGAGARRNWRRCARGSQPARCAQSRRSI